MRYEGKADWKQCVNECMSEVRLTGSNDAGKVAASARKCGNVCLTLLVVAAPFSASTKSLSKCGLMIAKQASKQASMQDTRKEKRPKVSGPVGRKVR